MIPKWTFLPTVQCALQPMQCVYFIYMINCNVKDTLSHKVLGYMSETLDTLKKVSRWCCHEASSWATELILMVCISSKLRSRPSYIIVKQKAKCNILNTEVYKINNQCNFGKREVLNLKSNSDIYLFGRIIMSEFLNLR